MARTKKPGRRYSLKWQYSPRLVVEHLGSQKYTRSSHALGELVANAFDAGATKVELRLLENKLGGVDSIFLSDDGAGISPQELRERFRNVGVSPSKEASQKRFGRFGVGRLAVFRIGRVSTWESVTAGADDSRTRVTVKLDSERRDGFSVVEEPAPRGATTGTSITITNLLEANAEGFSVARIRTDLLTQFCGFLLGHPQKVLEIQDVRLDVASLIEERQLEVIPAEGKMPAEANVTHLLLHRGLDRSRFPDQLIFAAKGRTVASVQPEEDPPANYLGIVECPYLDQLVTANRESLIELDGGFGELKAAAIQRAVAFGQQVRAARSTHFLERARSESFYPFRDHNAPSPIAQVQREIYDVVLEKVHEHANLEAMTKRQQAVVFRLLQRALENENLFDIIQQVADLSDDDVMKFRKLLERTTLASLIKFSSEVTNRLSFLDLLHEMVYGSVGRFMKERTQLHCILEPHCWLFGTRFHLATSDKSFREVIRRHRKLVELPDADDDAIAAIQRFEDIPDLFLSASREYPVQPRCHHVLVELKSPSVPLGRKEVEQIRRYAETILDSHEFDKTQTRWDLYLVSHRVAKEIDRDRKQDGQPFGRLWGFQNMDVWAFEWSEIISRSREELHLVRQHLDMKYKELSVSEYLRDNYPEIFADLQKRGAPVGSQSQNGNGADASEAVPT